MTTQPTKSARTRCMMRQVPLCKGLTAFDPVVTRSIEGRLQFPELTLRSDERRIVDGHSKEPILRSCRSRAFGACRPWLTMARSLILSVTADGVQTFEQAGTLKAMSFDYLQGCAGRAGPALTALDSGCCWRL